MIAIKILAHCLPSQTSGTPHHQLNGHQNETVKKCKCWVLTARNDNDPILTVQDTLVYMTVHTRQLSYQIEMFSASLLAEMKFGQFKCYI